jgi:hypothetical protein
MLKIFSLIFAAFINYMCCMGSAVASEARQKCVRCAPEARQKLRHALFGSIPKFNHFTRILLQLQRFDHFSHLFWAPVVWMGQ